MSRSNPRLTNEHLFYLLALILAAAVRFYRLGAAPLSDIEANWALQALQIAGDQPGGWVSPLRAQPAYGLLTAGLFSLFGVTNFLARFLPAAAGTALVLAPAFFRSQLGRPAALLLAFGLALDPGLVAASRQAGGPLPALLFIVLAAGFYRQHRLVLAGLAAGLGLLSGPSLVFGLVTIGIAWLALTLILGIPSRETPSTETYSPPRQKLGLRSALYSAGVAILLIGTLFLSVPEGLAAWVEGPVIYLSGWVGIPEVSALRMLAALPVYALLPLLFGLATTGRLLASARSLPHIPADLNHPMAFALFLALWTLVALLISLIYPARQVLDLVWVLAPLWGLAALELARHLPEGMVSPVAAGQAALVVVVLALFWLTLAGLAHTAPDTPGTGLRLGIMAGLLALVFLTSLLVALGWSWEAGRQGLAWGLAIALGLGSLSTLWGATQLRAGQPQELWSAQPAPGQIDLLVETVQELSVANTGFPQLIEIQTDLKSPALVWALKDFENFRMVQGVQHGAALAGSMPQILITAGPGDDPRLSAAYLGQDFAWNLRTDWPGALPERLAPWVAFREAAISNEQILLWARSDLFPGGEP